MNKSIIYLLFCAPVLLSACTTKPESENQTEEVSVPVVKVSSADAITEQDYPASIEGTENVEIRPQVSGFLDRIYVDEGSHVQAGQLLFKINEQPFRQQFNNAIGKLHAAEATVINAQLEVERMLPLVQNKVISDYQLKVAKATLSMAKASVEQASADVATAKINLGYTEVKAPVSGFIGRLPKKTGSILSPNDELPLTTLSDVHQLHVYFSLSEDDFVNFRLNYPGKSFAEKLKEMPSVSLLLSDNILYPLKGRIDMIDGQFNSNTGAITVRANFENPEGLLRSGNTGKVRMNISHHDVVLIPTSATLEIQDKVFVFKVNKKNVVSKQAIEITGKSGQNYLITKGVKSGDRIVSEGLDQVKEGSVIKPQKGLVAAIQHRID